MTVWDGRSTVSRGFGSTAFEWKFTADELLVPWDRDSNWLAAPRPCGISTINVRCGRVEFNVLLREYRHCTYRCRRYDVPRHKEFGQHKFKLARDRDPGFPLGFRSNDQYYLDAETLRIKQALARMAGESPMSVGAICSPSMVRFAQT
jgi:hypothetical protein